MTTSAGLPDGPRRDGLLRAMRTVRTLARAEADGLLGLVPDTGDHATGRAVDALVEQTADALRALDESLALTMSKVDGRTLEDGTAPMSSSERHRGRGAWRHRP